MRKQTKYALAIGTVFGAIAIAKATKKGVERTVHSVHKIKYKMLVKDKLQDAQKFIDIIDDLSDEEIEVMIGILDLIEDHHEAEAHSTSYLGAVKENAEELKNKFRSHVREDYL